ncbi:MAG: OsmC family protein [Candidatus Cloacimonetes bacterium]|nr:OsmC family protein [Candidatus Cloacimonadota bacterium]MBL7108235.1 OsmC family protein [Candidatus Cloacimonadota bacterium]
MKAEVKYIDNLQFSAVADSNHSIILDADKNLSLDQGSRPKELLLMGLAGCTAMDVVSILKKMRVEFRDFSVTAEAENSDEHPKVFTSISIKYFISGNVGEEKLEKAIELSQTRYCGVSVMLKKAAPITYSYEIKK